MARKSNDSELRELWQGAAAAGDDGMRRLVERGVQQVLEAEMTAFVGADSYERIGERRGYRNGYKPRTLETRVGELELMVPKDRDGHFKSEPGRTPPAQRESTGAGHHADVCGGRINTQGARHYRSAVRAGD